VMTVASPYITLKWSDPLGASNNDYDIFILNSTGTAVKGFSADFQDGTQDPYELVFQGSGCGTSAPSGYCPAAGDRIVVVLYDGAPRALRLDTLGGRLSLATAGSTFGHNAGASTVSTAATYWNSGRTGTRPFTGAPNVNETFSSDGPRKIFFNPDGTPITPGNLLFATNGGVTLQKPDIAAADGVATRTPGFYPFFGTSASAPHAAGIAALIFSVKPGWTPAQVLNAIKSTALDSMAAGVDRDSGYGIAMAWPAVQYALTH
jgi:subtilisin family serine protease